MIKQDQSALYHPTHTTLTLRVFVRSWSGYSSNNFHTSERPAISGPLCRIYQNYNLLKIIYGLPRVATHGQQRPSAYG